MASGELLRAKKDSNTKSSWVFNRRRFFLFVLPSSISSRWLLPDIITSSSSSDDEAPVPLDVEGDDGASHVSARVVLWDASCFVGEILRLVSTRRRKDGLATR